MIPETKRVFIVVKTYPTISGKYAELVCTAGVLEDGSWIRLYPIPFRKLELEQKYPKYSWIQVNAKRNPADFRPETYRPYDLSTIVVEPKPNKVDWDERRKIIFKNKKIYTNLEELIISAKSDGISLAVFKPTEVLDFVIEPDERVWNLKKLESLRRLSQQMNLFQSTEEIEAEFKILPKVPYKFFYTFVDDAGKQSRMMIEDWEIGMLYFNCLKKANGDESVAISKVREKFFCTFVTKDLHFFLGTTKRFHNVAPNPFIIIGVFYPPMQSPNKQMNLFDL
jgi:hypothetical protein